MRLKYETGIATLIQFVVLNLLGIAIAAVEMVSGCQNHGSACSTNLFLSPVVFLLKIMLYGVIALLGYEAQRQRSKRLAWMLIAMEVAIFPFALFNLKHDSNYLTRATSLLDIIFIVWVVVLAYRLAKSNGGRIVTSSRRTSRHRRGAVKP